MQLRQIGICDDFFILENVKIDLFSMKNEICDEICCN